MERLIAGFSFAEYNGAALAAAKKAGVNSPETLAIFVRRHIGVYYYRHAGFDEDVIEAGSDIKKLRWMVIDLRNTIRRDLRDVRGHDRCWLDDSLVYGHLPEKPGVVAGLYSKEQFMAECMYFKTRRVSPLEGLLGISTEEFIAAVERMKSKIVPDKDLLGKDCCLLKMDVVRLRFGMRKHAAEERKTWVDDAWLCNMLPEGENIPMVTALPEDFLNGPKGCEAFYKSRPSPCPAEKLHWW